MVDIIHENFLLERIAGVRHSGGTFYRHLKNTYDMLRDWDNPKHVCLAGLFHSIYGTKSFEHKAVALTDRHLIVELIGKEAENLVYRFCTSDRAKEFFEEGAEYEELREIEVANLIEQKNKNFKYLNKLVNSKISSMARLFLLVYLDGIGNKQDNDLSAPS